MSSREPKRRAKEMWVVSVREALRKTRMPWWDRAVRIWVKVEGGMGWVKSTPVMEAAKVGARRVIVRGLEGGPVA
jgi:hypothetical protein